MRRRHFAAFAPRCPRCARDEAGRHALTLDAVLEERDDDVLSGILHCLQSGLPPRIPDHRRHPSHRPRARRPVGGARHRAAAARGPRSGAGEPDRRRDRSRHLARHACARPCRPMPGTAGPTWTLRRPILPTAFSQAPCGAAWPRLLDMAGESAAGRRHRYRLRRRPDRLRSWPSAAATPWCLASISISPCCAWPARRPPACCPIRDGASASCMTAAASRSPCRGAERVDFWACDALALPFAPGAADLAVALNLLDCVSEPRRLLAGLAEVVRPRRPACCSRRPMTGRPARPRWRPGSAGTPSAQHMAALASRSCGRC